MTGFLVENAKNNSKRLCAGVGRIICLPRADKVRKRTTI